MRLPLLYFCIWCPTLALAAEPPAPPVPPAPRYQLETKPARHVFATLTTDIAHPEATVESWYVYAPQAPELPSQTNVQTRFSLDSRVVQEGSSLKRPLLFAQIDDGRKELHAVLAIEATLISRHLRRLAPGQEASKVKELSAQETRDFLRTSEKLDFDRPAFRDWLAKTALKRNADEDEIDFARRAFLAIKHNFTYEYPTGDRAPTAVCTRGKSDCGGLSSLMVAVLRSNRVPARTLGGRWAVSEDPKSSNPQQFHVKGEFFARGVGWVPFDMASAILWTKEPSKKNSPLPYSGEGQELREEELAYFGNDRGDHLAMVVDQDLLVDSRRWGKKNLLFLQGLAYWWSGSGPDGNGSYRQSWKVEKLKVEKL